MSEGMTRSRQEWQGCGWNRESFIKSTAIYGYVVSWGVCECASLLVKGSPTCTKARRKTHLLKMKNFRIASGWWWRRRWWWLAAQEAFPRDVLHIKTHATVAAARLLNWRRDRWWWRKVLQSEFRSFGNKEFRCLTWQKHHVQGIRTNFELVLPSYSLRPATKAFISL